MAVYRCPHCGDTVRKEAKRCSTCGLWFDLEREPVLDDGQGKPENVRKKEKKGAIIAVAVLVVYIVISIAVSIRNARFYIQVVGQLK
jgi:predicted ATP-dependent serine protease